MNIKSIASHVIIVFVAFFLSAMHFTSSAAGPEESQPWNVSLKFDTPNKREFLKAVLESMGLAYEVKEKPDGIWVQWWSTDPAQEIEIQNRVSQFSFISQACDEKSLPPPNRPAQKNLSCK